MNIVLIAAWALAVLSALFVRPDAAYIDYIDFHTLGLLFCLMTVMAGLNRSGIFARAAQRMLASVKGSRQLEWILIFLCFVSSMFITNDVALITFVPFAIQTLELADMKGRMVPVIALQTVAANLGSMLTPIGNPQNLYLYSRSGMSAGGFVMLMLPYTLLAAVLLSACIFLQKNVSLKGFSTEQKQSAAPPVNVAVYGILFFLCLGGVARVVPVWALALILLAVVIPMDRKTLKEVDYSLLLTFAGFFIFIGNMGRMPGFCSFLERIIEGREILTAALSSQVISNVPAALLLSGFTEEWEALIIGTNIGGLGTLIASMASLISYRFIVSACPKEKGRYMVYFTGINVGMLAVFLGVAMFR